MADPMDLFEQAGISPNYDERDLFQKYGIKMDMPKQKSVLDKVYDAVQKGATSNLNAFLGMGDSVQNLMANVINAVPQVADFTGGKRYNVPLARSASGAPYEAGRVVGDIGGFLAGGEALDAARAASEAVPLIGQLAKALGSSKALPTAGRIGAGSAIYGGVTNPNDRLKGAVEQGLLGGAVGGASSLATDVLKKFLPSNYLKKNISESDLLKNLEAAGDTKTNLGRVIQNPKLAKQYENTLANIPLSDVEKQVAETKNYVTHMGNNIVNKYLGDTPVEDVNQKLASALTIASKEQNSFKNKLYDNVNKLAEKSDFKLDTPKFKEVTKKYKNILEDQDFLKFEPESINLLKKLTNYEKLGKNSDKEILDKFGNAIKSTKSPSLKEANMLAGKLGSLSNEFRASANSQDRNTARVLSELSKSLKNDIKSSISESGNEQLQTEFNNAEKNYKENFSPFLDKEIYKFTHGNKDPDMLVSSFIKTGPTTDKANHLNKLMSKLSPEDQNLVKYSYLSRALKGDEDNRVVDPYKLRNLWNDTKLGPNQKKALMPDPEERKQMEKFSRLVNMNSDVLDSMRNPATGNRLMSLLPYGIAHGLSGIGGAYLGDEHGGGLPGAVLGGLLGLGATGLGSRAIANKLTSPEFRRNLIEKMLTKKNNKTTIPTNAAALSAALYNMKGGK